MRIVFHPHAKLIGDRRKIALETLVSDLEYADDMALMFSSWSDLEVMIKSLHQYCTAIWDLPSTAERQRHWQVCPPQPILHCSSEDLVKPVSAF